MRERSCCFSSVGRVNPSFSWIIFWVNEKFSTTKISSIQSNLKMHLPTPIRGLLIITPMHLQFFFSFVTKPPWNIWDENKKKVAQSQTKGIFDSLILSTFLINFIWVLLSQLEIPTIFWWSYWLVYWSYGLVPLRLLCLLRILRILRGIYFHPKKKSLLFSLIGILLLNFYCLFHFVNYLYVFERFFKTKQPQQKKKKLFKLILRK